LSVATCLIPSGLRRRGETRHRKAGPRTEAAELGREIVSMPEAMRRCFILHYHSGFGPSEIAELLRLPLEAVIEHLEEARRRLRPWLEETGP
jgi:DNA-directed RNA polymerase specialized sigma24 family protein